MILNFRKGLFIRLIINPFLIGLVITVVISLFIRDRFERFRVRLVDAIPVSRHSQNYFHDMNGDTFSEWIEFGYDYDDMNFPYYTIYSGLEEGFRLIHDQYNPQRQWLMQSRAAFGDVDGDGWDEVLHFTFRDDSLFLFCGDPMEGVTERFEIFLDSVSFRDDFPDFSAVIESIQDFNGNGTADVLVRINAGHSLVPREYYIYYVDRDTLVRSKMGYAHVGEAKVLSLPEYGPVILPSSSYSPQNVNFQAYLTDTISWMVLMNSNLEFVFDPVPCPGYKTGVQAFFFVREDDTTICALFRDHDKKTNPPTIKIFDFRGEVLAERTLNEKSLRNVSLVAIPGDEGTRMFLSDLNGPWVSEILPDLSIGKPISCMLNTKYAVLDLEGDGDVEIINIIPSNVYTLYIYTSGLSDKVELGLGAYPGTIIFSPLHSQDRFANMAIQLEDMLTFYTYERNPGLIRNYIILAISWFLLSLFLYFILLLQKRMLRRKYENERKMMELELMTIKNQVDPHFMFNTMNSIGSYILKEEKKKAYQYLIDFSQMIRSTLSHSKDISISLEDEIAFVWKYLELEQLRLNSSIEFSINVAPGIDRALLIPKMIIQTFAENAVRHGLRHKKGHGKLEIEVWKNEGNLVIRIEDNGIGREGSRNLKTQGTGHGQNIVSQIISLFNRLNKTDVTFKIKDLKDDHDHPTGTRVEVCIPRQ